MTQAAMAKVDKPFGPKGQVIWFTGLSGAGKSKLAQAFFSELKLRGYHVIVLDGDDLRQGLCKDLGFTDQDRSENIRRGAEVAKLLADAGFLVLAAFISPFRAERDRARELIGADRFFEVWVSTSLQVCEQRDVKGLYRRARKGELKNITGIDALYEPPLHPNVIIDTEFCSVLDSLKALHCLIDKSSE